MFILIPKTDSSVTVYVLPENVTSISSPRSPTAKGDGWNSEVEYFGGSTGTRIALSKLTPVEMALHFERKGKIE